MRRVTNAVLIVVLAGLAVTIGAQAGTSSHARPAALAKTCGALTTPPARYSHVIWIWMENHSFGQIIGRLDRPPPSPHRT
jgi:surface antigen